MKFFEYPNYLYTYFKDNDLENNLQLAKKIVDDNSGKFYLRTDGILFQLIEEGKESLYSAINDSFNPLYKEYRGKFKKSEVNNV